MKIARSVFGIAIVVIAFALVSMTLAVENEAPTEDFSGKTGLVYLDQEMRVPSVVLTSAEVREIRGRPFLVGIGADTKRAADWKIGRVIRISWNSVTAYVLFTPKEFGEYARDSLPKDEDT